MRETLDKCPERNVRINVYAEKFQTNTAAVTQQVEEEIGKRIRFLHCVLYCEDIYVMDTLIENISGVNVSLVPIDFGELPFGRYNLVIIGNCKSDAMEGDFHRWGGMSLLYLGADRTDDMFGAFLSFTVDCNCALQFETKLRRLLGVVSCEIKGIPDEVTEFEVIFHRVNSRLSEGGNYDTPVDVVSGFRWYVPEAFHHKGY